MPPTSLYADVLTRFKDRPILTLGTGATCAYLGDERNLREFLVADETARRLRQAGHTVFNLLIDDSFDPLDYRQLRVAVHKDPALIERYQDWCGKPIGMLPDPWGCHESYAAHFEHLLLERLNHLGCCPTPISTYHLYERGLYAPYVATTLERAEAIHTFLHERFDGYRPEKLFWVLCPHCAYLDETQIESLHEGCARMHCRRCDHRATIPFGELKGKLNWKLDCAARWAMLKIDAEPFNKSYMEPKTGTFAIAQALSLEFFGGHPVMPLQYGLVKMDKSLSYKLLATLPASVLRSLFVERPSSDLTLTNELLVTTASRHQVLPGMSYLDTIKQMLPLWLLTPEALTPFQRNLMAHGSAFSEEFLGQKMRLCLPSRGHFVSGQERVMRALYRLLGEAIRLRAVAGASWHDFHEPIKACLAGLGDQKKEVAHYLRALVGQTQGMPVGRLLFLLPLDYLALLEYLLELAADPFSAEVRQPAPLLAA